MTKFSNKFKKPCFWPIFPIFGAKKIFLENPALSRTTSYGSLAPCQNLEKVIDTIQRKRPDRRKDGRMDEQTLFYRTLPATAGGSTSTTAVDKHLKVKDTEKDVGLKLLYYCQHAKNLLNS